MKSFHLTMSGCDNLLILLVLATNALRSVKLTGAKHLLSSARSPLSKKSPLASLVFRFARWRNLLKVNNF